VSEELSKGEGKKRSGRCRRGERCMRYEGNLNREIGGSQCCFPQSKK